MSESQSSDRGSIDSMQRSKYSCVSCRRRKLGCDRKKTGCKHCIRLSVSCSYPERKKAKRTTDSDMKLLAARLSQIEDRMSDLASARTPNLGKLGVASDTKLQRKPASESTTSSIDTSSFTGPRTTSAFEWRELVDYATWASPCPVEIMQQLSDIFFSNIYPAIPILNPYRYRQATISGSHDQLPMCLHYAVWTIAAFSDPLYRKNTTSFYKQAKRYAEDDELKQAHITLAHAQTFAILSMFEAMTRRYDSATLSSAKCVRLCQLLCLDRLDAVSAWELRSQPAATFDLEEGRRVFWVAFTLDRHTFCFGGTPVMLAIDKIYTRLPASDEAFLLELTETTCFLHESLAGAPFDGFSTTVVICEIYKRILEHTLTLDIDDGEWDYLNGNFWSRHRGLEETLTTLSRSHLLDLDAPASFCNHNLVIFNVNLYSAIISLHHAAAAVAERFCFPPAIIAVSRRKLMESAAAIATIIKKTTNIDKLFMSPLCAVSMYCATTVYQYAAQFDADNSLDENDYHHLQLILQAMLKISHLHPTVQDLVVLACNDMERVGLRQKISLPDLDSLNWDSSNSIRPLEAPPFIRMSLAKYKAIRLI